MLPVVAGTREHRPFDSLRDRGHPEDDLLLSDNGTITRADMQKHTLAPGSPLAPKTTTPPGPFEAAQRDIFSFTSHSLSVYLLERENAAEDIATLDAILQREHVILEIGCGSGSIAREIACKNPDLGVIATDQYDWDIPSQYGSYYRKIALAWKHRELAPQQDPLTNLVLLRADLGILSYLPQERIDTVLMVNPEPRVGRTFLEALTDTTLYRKIKSGEMQLVILPFSREMGVTSCGGCEFDHDMDWSRGLGFLMASGFDFRKGEAVQWGVNLVKASLYSSNSTQGDVYIFGMLPSADASLRKNAPFARLKSLLQSARRRFKRRV